MQQRIVIKRSTVAGRVPTLAAGELAVNLADRLLFTADTNGNIITLNANVKESVVAISVNTSSACSITGSGNSGKSETIIYTNSGSSDLTVTVPTTYQTPDGQAMELTCPVGGYCEVSYLNIGGVIYARGL